MDWADDVAYSVHDVEDGVHRPAGSTCARSPTPTSARRWPSAARSPAHADRSADERSRSVLTDLLAVGRGRASSTARGRARSALKRLTSELIGRFAARPIAATRAARRRPAAPLRRRPGGAAAARAPRCAVLKAVAAAVRDVRPAAPQPIQAEQRSCSPTLVDGAARRGAPATLDPPFAATVRRGRPTTAARLRVVIDQVACSPTRPAGTRVDRSAARVRRRTARRSQRLERRPWPGGSAIADIAAIRERSPHRGHRRRVRRAAPRGRRLAQGTVPVPRREVAVVPCAAQPRHFHCFGCGEGGDVYSLPAEDRAHQLRRVRRAAGRPDRLPAHLRGRRHVDVQRDRGTRTRLVAANAAAAGVLRGAVARAGGRRRRGQYLTERNFDGDAAAHVRLRLRPRRAGTR